MRIEAKAARRLSKSKRKSHAISAQSAMEYLMTYGWAILIISIVLGVLYYLGLFSGISGSPRLPPGSCSIFRPNGPGTSFDANLQGMCSGELPEYVAEFSGSSNVSVGTFNFPTGSSSVTVTAWVYFTSTTGNPTIFSYGTNTVSEQMFLWIDTSSNDVLKVSSPGHAESSTLSVQPDTWSFVAFSRQAGLEGTIYLDSNSYTGGGLPAFALTLPPTDPADIGKKSNGGLGYFIGQIANVQLYNTSLSANEIQAIYLEGIGGAPVSPAYNVGWWPLNGNLNDYSGNGNTGGATNVMYTGAWTSGYTPP